MNFSNSSTGTGRGATDHVVGVDLGGSNVRVVLGDASGRPVANIAAPTAQGRSDAVVGQIATLARELTDRVPVDWSRVRATAVGVPGVVHAAGGGVRDAASLPPFADVDLAGALKSALGVYGAV